MVDRREVIASRKVLRRGGNNLVYEFGEDVEEAYAFFLHPDIDPTDAGWVYVEKLKSGGYSNGHTKGTFEREDDCFDALWRHLLLQQKSIVIYSPTMDHRHEVYKRYVDADKKVTAMHQSFYDVRVWEREKHRLFSRFGVRISNSSPYYGGKETAMVTAKLSLFQDWLDKHTKGRVFVDKDGNTWTLKDDVLWCDDVPTTISRSDLVRMIVTMERLADAVCYPAKLKIGRSKFSTDKLRKILNEL